MVAPKDTTTLPEIWNAIVFDFLVGLKPEFDEVSSKVLGKESIPCLSYVVSYVNAEEG